VNTGADQQQKVRRSVNSDFSESLAAKLRNKSPERSAEYCQVKIQHNDQFLNLLQLQTENTLQSVHTLPREYPVRFQQ
jgi:hypothetical protein